MTTYNFTYGANKIEFFWICTLVLSFYYELSLIELTPFDRLNPRLFDVFFFLGIIFVSLRFKRRITTPDHFKVWAAIVFTFATCSIIWTIGWLPTAYGKFSLFYAIKYLLGLYCIYMVVKIPLTPSQKEMIHRLIILGGVFVGVYATWEYSQGFTSREIAGGKLVHLNKGTILGPLGHTYFHIAMISSLSVAMAAAMLKKAKTLRSKAIYLGTVFIGGWPAFFCGSRAAILAVVIILAFLFSTNTRSRVIFIAILIIGLIFLEVVYIPDESNISLTFSRFERMEDVGHNSFLSRITLSGYSFDLYEWQGWLIPFIGAGFGVAPHATESGALFYRIGYGIHNCYLFALEQGGVIAFILFLAFLRKCWKRLKNQRNSIISEDRVFAEGVSAFFVALICVAWTGQVFWLTSGTENLTTYIIILIMLATKKSTFSYNKV